MTSFGWRYQARSYNDVYNLDTNSNVYGGLSEINQFDLRLSHKPVEKLELAVGVDNLFDNAAFASHPYPDRTFFVNLRMSSR
jgi:iron complex outermembrane receptor protein